MRQLLPRRDRPEPGQDHGRARAPGRVPAARAAGPGSSKPVGQRTVIDRRRAGRRGRDPDADGLRPAASRSPAMSPVHIPRGFTKRYIAGDVVEDLGAQILRGPRGVRRPRHPRSSRGPGTPAWGRHRRSPTPPSRRCSGRPAVIISEGGVGRPIDEIVLNASHFEAPRRPGRGRHREQGRRRRASPGIERTLERGLALHGIPLLGVLPYRPDPVQPHPGHGPRGRPAARRIHPGPDLDRVIDGVAIGAMEPQPHARARSGRGTLVIVPGRPRGRDPHPGDGPPRRAASARGHRAARGAGRRDAGRDRRRTRGQGARARPDRRLPAAPGGPRRDPRTPTCSPTLVAEDTYTVASEVHDLLVKTHPADAGKIELIKALVWEHLHIDRFLEVATEARLD